MAQSGRAFVLRHTRLRPVPGLAELRLHLADEVLPLWHAVQLETRNPDAPLPFWAFAWAGGLAIARHLDLDPALVIGRRVLDLGTGSGLCSIAALRAGADRAMAVDVDPLAINATELNARANGVRVATALRDVLDEPPPDVDVIVAGDCFYEEPMAGRVARWLRRARDRGIEVVVGDPGRRYLPSSDLLELATYEVRTTTELEDLEWKRAAVHLLRPVEVGLE